MSLSNKNKPYCIQDSTVKYEPESHWTSQATHIVKLVPGTTETGIQVGVCVSPGQATLRKSTQPPHDSLVGLIEVVVRPLERVRFFSRSVKHVSNAVSTEISNQVQFQVVGAMSISHNCSSEFEQSLRLSRQPEQLNPFKCSASLYTESGRRLSYLDRLISTSVSFAAQHWTCEVKFVANSDALMYDLIENHVDRPVLSAPNKSPQQLIDEFSRENEPALILIQVACFIRLLFFIANQIMSTFSHYFY